MEKIKIISGAVLGLFSRFIGGFTQFLEIYIIVDSIDFFFGVIAALYVGEFKSKILTRGLVKKLCIYGLIAFAYWVGLGIGQPALKEIFTGYFLFATSISVLNNSEKMGIAYPKKIKELLGKLRDKMDNLDPDNKGE